MGLREHNSESSLADLFAAYRQTTGVEARNAVADRIVDMIYAPLSQFISGRRVHPDGVADVLQATLIGIFNGILVFRGKTHGEAWSFCYRIAFNKAVNSIRASKRDLAATVLDDSFWEAVEASADNRHFAEGERLDLELVMGLLRVAKPPCVDYLHLHYIDGLTYEQIGDVLDEDGATAGVTGRRCLELAQKLAAQLKSAGKLD